MRVGLGGPVELLDVDGIRDSFDINVFGHIQMTQVFLPLLRKSKQGRIIFTVSAAGLFVIPLTSAYSASSLLYVLFPMLLSGTQAREYSRENSARQYSHTDMVKETIRIRR